ncbi:MAG: HDOD domain-containing protein [Gammaproteobacteria bacterium]|nr:HDOD domain-containing protein [Gammaproteobacteria bacterium]
MLIDSRCPEVSQLRKIRSLSLFNDEELNSLAATLMIGSAGPGEKIISIGDVGSYDLYLLSGSAIELGRGGSKMKVRGEVDGFLRPLASTGPALSDLVATSEVDYLMIDRDHLSHFSQLLEPDSSGIEVEAIEQSDEANELTILLCQEIMNGRIRVPAMTDIALKIQKLFVDDRVEAKALGDLIQTDPSLAARLLRTANSPFYRGEASVDSLPQAIVRMGMEAVRKQVLMYAASELLRETSSEMKQQMQKLWRDSRRVAAFSRILAQRTSGFDAEAAQMAGLLSNLGEVAIRQYVQDHGDLLHNEVSLDEIIVNLRPQINAMLMLKWNLGDELIIVAEESHDWFRNHRDEADLCDLVLIARYYSYLGSALMKGLPLLSKLPAFEKLKAMNFNPGESMVFLKDSQAEVEAVEDMLGTV